MAFISSIHGVLLYVSLYVVRKARQKTFSELAYDETRSGSQIVLKIFLRMKFFRRLLFTYGRNIYIKISDKNLLVKQVPRDMSRFL